MDWTIKQRGEADHSPTVVVNGKPGTEPLVLDAPVGSAIKLDATGTADPDGPRATVVPKTAGIAHVMPVVEDGGTPSLTSYRRVVLNMRPAMASEPPTPVGRTAGQD